MKPPSWRTSIAHALRGKRVVPPDPPGRTSSPACFKKEPDMAARRVVSDAAAAWSAHITYVDDHGVVTHRTIKINRIDCVAGVPTHILADCELRGWRRRSFRIDRITEMVCVNTGEVIDPLENAIILQRMGAVKAGDPALTHVMRVLAFTARCDGEFHAMEQRSIHNQIVRYALRFDGDDAMLETAAREAMRLAPSGIDLRQSLGWIAKRGPQLARFTLEAASEVMEADGWIANEEFSCALEVVDALKQIADGR